MYTEALDKILVNGTMSTSKWTKFIDKLSVELGKYSLIVCALIDLRGLPSHPPAIGYCLASREPRTHGYS